MPTPRPLPQRRLVARPVNPSRPRGHGEGENTVPQRHAELGGGIRRDFVARRGSEVVADEETHVLIFSKRPVFPRAPSGAQDPFKNFGPCRNRAYRGRAGAVVVGVGGWWWWFGVGHVRGPDPSTLENCARRWRRGGGEFIRICVFRTPGSKKNRRKGV